LAGGAGGVAPTLPRDLNVAASDPRERADANASKAAGDKRGARLPAGRRGVRSLRATMVAGSCPASAAVRRLRAVHGPDGRIKCAASANVSNSSSPHWSGCVRAAIRGRISPRLALSFLLAARRALRR
jgi:hypothetical protein